MTGSKKKCHNLKKLGIFSKKTKIIMKIFWISVDIYTYGYSNEKNICQVIPNSFCCLCFPIDLWEKCRRKVYEEINGRTVF